MQKKKQDYFLIIGICVALICVIAFVAVFITLNGGNGEENSSSPSAVEYNESSDLNTSSILVLNSETSAEGELNRDYSRLILVNGQNPLSSDYDYTGNLITIDKKYLCGYRNQMDKDAYVYAKAMVEAAWRDNVELYILSPYRSYSSQVTLFNNEVAEWKNRGYFQADAEKHAATEVARPGTSEHHTGLAIDFNSVEGTFEDTEAFNWLMENGEDYGFILRYPENKQDLTGVIYEPWHWRFVGINSAKEINRLGYCLEEYKDYLEGDF